jgi:hypothetical protein
LQLNQSTGTQHPNSSVEKSSTARSAVTKLYNLQCKGVATARSVNQCKLTSIKIF